MTSELSVIVRSFQRGATFSSFDDVKFNTGVRDPLRKLLSTAPSELSGIVLVSCGEVGSSYAEEVCDGHTPTTLAIHREFPKEVASGMISTVVSNSWGLNAGSATAINDGIAVARRHDADLIMVWSPEIDLSGHMITEMLGHMDSHSLRLVGYMRSRWYQRLQWTFAQNTCAIWDDSLLREIGDMNPSCNGATGVTVSTIECGDVLLAGMEDMDAYLRASARVGEFVRWGCVGMRHPATWNLALKKPGTGEYDDLIKKIARQGHVMDAYARTYFPDREPIDVWDEMMKVASFS